MTNLTLFLLGYKLAMKALRNGQSKLLIISNNCPAIRKTQLEYMAILANSDVIHYDGNNVELGKYTFFSSSPSPRFWTRSNLLNLISNRYCPR